MLPHGDPTVRLDLAERGRFRVPVPSLLEIDALRSATLTNPRLRFRARADRVRRATESPVAARRRTVDASGIFNDGDY